MPATIWEYIGCMQAEAASPAADDEAVALESGCGGLYAGSMQPAPCFISGGSCLSCWGASGSALYRDTESQVSRCRTAQQHQWSSPSTPSMTRPAPRTSAGCSCSPGVQLQLRSRQRQQPFTMEQPARSEQPLAKRRCTTWALLAPPTHSYDLRS